MAYTEFLFDVCQQFGIPLLFCEKKSADLLEK